MEGPNDFFLKPITKSWHFESKVPEKCAKGEPAFLGVDEAGRGPVLGSMIYAASYCLVEDKLKLSKMKFADSKVLKEAERDNLFEQLQAEHEWIGWAVHSCSPQDISESMLRRAKYNLNAIAHDTTIEMIQRVLKQGVNLTEIYIDTVGPCEKYQEKLMGFFPGIDITVAKKADSLYPIVSAASICAKVTRDKSLREWKFIEVGLDTSKNFGSGYPGDPNTVRWLKDNMDPVFGFPRVIRFSWSTTSNFLKENAVEFKWASDEDPEQPSVVDLWLKKTANRDDIFKRLEMKNIKAF